jgi:hypothetical protein
MLSAQFVKVIYGRSYYLLLYLHCRHLMSKLQ